MTRVNVAVRVELLVRGRRDGSSICGEGDYQRHGSTGKFLRLMGHLDVEGDGNTAKQGEPFRRFKSEVGYLSGFSSIREETPFE